jgi:hypothetical protein
MKFNFLIFYIFNLIVKNIIMKGLENLYKNNKFFQLIYKLFLFF